MLGAPTMKARRIRTAYKATSSLSPQVIHTRWHYESTAASRAGDGTTTATVLSSAMIAEGMKVVAAGTNPVQLTRGIDATVKKLV